MVLRIILASSLGKVIVFLQQTPPNTTDFNSYADDYAGPKRFKISSFFFLPEIHDSCHARLLSPALKRELSHDSEISIDGRFWGQKRLFPFSLSGALVEGVMFGGGGWTSLHLCQ